MMRYVAQKGDLLGKTAQDEAKCAMVAGAVSDMFAPVMSYAFKAFKEGQEDEAKVAVKDAYEKFSPGLEKLGSEHGAAGHMVGDRLTYADVLVAEALVAIEERMPGLTSSSPKLTTVKDAVLAALSVKAYLESGLRWPSPDLAYVQNVEKVLRRG